jgi:hypothetical protein
MGHAHHRKKTGPGSQIGRRVGRLLGIIILAGLASGCSFSAAWRTLHDYPEETLECFPACPSVTEPMLLRHPATATLVECGPYPYALYSSMAAVYRLERRQCVERYQRQGYVLLPRVEAQSAR